MMYRYKYPERFEGVDMPDFDALQGNLILFGAGLYGGIASALLRDKGYDFICFCDNNVNKQGKMYCEHKVMSPEQCFESYPQADIIIAVHNYTAIYDQLKKIGFSRIHSCASLFLEFDISVVEPILQQYDYVRQLDSMMYTYLRRVGNAFGGITAWGKREKSAFMPQIDICTTTRCTLRCKDCTSLMPFYKEPGDADWERMKFSLNRLMNAVENCLYLLEGGEVFLYPYLAEMIQMLTNHPNTDYVWIITNGTIIPDSNVLETLKNPKCLVRISDYGSCSKKKDELKTLCESSGIQVIIYIAKWTRMSEIRDYKRSAEQNQIIYNNCCKAAGGALFLLNDKLYICPFAANAENLGIIPKNADDRVDLSQEPFNAYAMKEQLKALFERQEYVEACKYCNGRNSSGLYSDVVSPAEQLTGPIPPLPKIE